VKIDLTSNIDQQSTEILIDSNDFWVAEIKIRAIDEAGTNVFDSTHNQYTIKIKSEDGDDLLYKDGCNIANIGDLINSIRWKGFILNWKTKYTIEIKGDGKPTSTIDSYNVRFYVDLIGYRLANKI